jgi:DNA-binding SARP family transcriptional activator
MREGVAAPAGGANVTVTTDQEIERPTTAAATRPRPQLWRLNVLGPVELCYDGRVVDVSGPTRTLLAMLARNPGTEIETADIVAGLWGSEVPEDAEKEVASHVSRLRKALTVVAPDEQPTTIVVTMPHGYILDITPSNADTLAFERSVTDGRRALSVGQPALALSRLDAGLALWRGPAFADFGDHAIVRSEASRLEDLRLAAVESRVDAVLALSAPGVPDGLVEELRTLTGQYWHRERFWAQLMIALARTGRRGDALAVFREASDKLADGLGASPGADLRATERAVVASDASLSGVAPRYSAVPEPLAATVPACVGRDEEIEWLLAALDLAATRRAQGRLVIGSTGIGKSRLVAAVAQRAAERGAAISHFRADTRDLDTLMPPADRLSLVVVEDLDQGAHEDVSRVVDFLRTAPTRSVVVLVTCRDSVRVGDLAGMPKLVLSTLDDHAVAEIVRVYAPTATDATASSAMINAGGVPAKVHRAASEWAFGRAGRRIDRAVADAAEPVRRLAYLRDEVIGGVHDLAHVRAQARPLRSLQRPPVAEPYRGLVTLGVGDGGVFHGREQLVAELVARLVGAPLLAVVGDVGTGTSSVVLAGLLPTLRGGVLPDSAQWRTVVLTPADVVGRSLAELLDSSVDSSDSSMDDADPDADTEEADFEPSSDTAEETDDDLSRPAGESTEDAPVLLVVDQFEEAFTALDGPTRTEFMRAVVDAAQTGRVVLTLRSDFYGRCAEHAELGALVTANTVLVAPMTEAELRRAIVAPAVAAGLRVERALVDQLVADASRAPGGLAHLAAALRAVWRRGTGVELNLDTYRATGDLATAIAAHGERVLAALPTDADRDQAARILVALTTTVDGRLVRRRVPATKFPLPILARLVEHRLVTVHEGHSGEESVEIAHEALVEHWPRLRAALADEAAERNLRRHLAETAASWAERGRDSADLYRGARLAAAMDLARIHRTELATVEHDFLGASQRVVLAAEIRRRRRVSQLWRWLAATVTIALLAVGVAAVAIYLQVRSADQATQAGAQRLAAAALAEPDPRRALLLAVASSTVDGGTTDAVSAVLARSPDLLGSANQDVSALAASPDGRTVAVGTGTGGLFLYTGATLSQGVALENPSAGAVTGLAFTPDGHRLASWGSAGITVWDVTAQRALASPFGSGPAEGGGGLLADGVTLVLPGPVAWDLDARTPSTAYQLPTGATGVVVSPGGRFMALQIGGSVQVLEPATGHSRTLAGASHPVALSADGRTVITANADVIGVWDAVTGARRDVRPGGTALGAAFAPDGKSFTGTGGDGHATVWDMASLAVQKTYAMPAGALAGFAADGGTLFTAGPAGVYSWATTGSRPAENGASLRAVACALAGRDLTPAEWSAAAPSLPYRHVCP